MIEFNPHDPANPNYRLAREVKDLDLVRTNQALDDGASPDFTTWDKQGRNCPVLYIACEKRSLEMVRRLIERGADPNGCLDHGRDLEYCLRAAIPDLGIMEALLLAGAKPDGAADWVKAVHSNDREAYFEYGFSDHPRMPHNLTAEVIALLRRFGWDPLDPTNYPPCRGGRSIDRAVSKDEIA